MHGCMIHHLPVMSYDTSPTNDHMIHHLSSMHSHVLGYITYHRCMVMSYDTSPTINACMVMSSHIYNITVGDVSYDYENESMVGDE